MHFRTNITGFDTILGFSLEPDEEIIPDRPIKRLSALGLQLSASEGGELTADSLFLPADLMI
jgi:hypothetical protein